MLLDTSVRVATWALCLGAGFFVASDFVGWPLKVFSMAATGLLCAAIDRCWRCRHCGKK